MELRMRRLELRVEEEKKKSWELNTKSVFMIYRVVGDLLLLPAPSSSLLIRG
jgi:hypothetical protein